MSRSLTRLKSSRPVSFTTLLGLVLVPLTVAGVLLWGLWNPTERLNDVTAAVVNLDEPVTIDGKTAPIGRLLAGELIDGSAETNFHWVLTDEADAKAGLRDGSYATVVTIPKNFSASIASLADGPRDAQVATIEVAESERGKLIDPTLSTGVTQAATDVMNRQLGEQSVANLFAGMSELHTGVSDAADGATKLADGGQQLTDGAQQLADGVTQLSDGAGQLSSGAGSLSSGAAELSTGASGLSAAATELATGATGLDQGLSVFVNGDPAMNQNGLSDLAAQTKAYTDGVTAALSGLTGLNQGASAAIAPLTQFRGLVAAGMVPFPSPAEKDAALAQLDELIAGLTKATSSIQESQITELSNAGPQLAAGTQGALAGAQQISTKLHEYADGVSQYAQKSSEFAGGAAGLATGAAELAQGASGLATNAPQLETGATDLVSGADKSAAGAKDLATGLASAANGIPNYTQVEREQLAKTMITPVKAEGTNTEVFTASGAPLFAGIALWAGALAMFLVLAPLWRRTREAARSVGAITLRSVLPTVGLGAVQGAIAGVLLPISLGYDLSQSLGFFGFSLLAGIAFALSVQGLSALLGGFGRFLAFAMLVLAFALGVVSTVPGTMTALGVLTPVTAAFTGFQAIAAGSGTADGAALVLVVWGALGVVMTALAVGRARRR